MKGEIFMEQEIKRFIYIDKEGVESLYCQLSNKITTTKTITTKYTDGKVSSSVGIDFLKTLTAKHQSQIESRNQIQEEKQNEITVENKIETILQNINGKKIDRLFDILGNGSYGGLIACKSLFRFVRAYDEDREQFVFQSDINGDPFKYKNLSFVFVSTPNLQCYSNDIDILHQSLNSGEYYVDMYFSGSKLIRGVRHLTNNIKYGSDFILYILGEITAEGGNIFCLKPYAIWRMTDRNM